MLSVFVIARDWLLRAGVRAELREKGIEALGMETLEDAAKAVAAGEMPAVAVLDGAAVREAAREALEQFARRIPVVVVASRGELVGIEPAVILYRPVRIGDVVSRVVELLQGRPA